MIVFIYVLLNIRNMVYVFIINVKTILKKKGTKILSFSLKTCCTLIIIFTHEQSESVIYMLYVYMFMFIQFNVYKIIWSMMHLLCFILL